MTIKQLLDDWISSEMEKLPLVFLGWQLFFSKWNLEVYYNTVNNNLDAFLLMAAVMKEILWYEGKIIV